jgi:hypothetical protein
MPFCRAIVAKVCLEHVRRHFLGDAGALGDPFDDLLYLVRPHEPALMEGKVGFQQRLEPSGQRYDPFLGLLAVRAALAAEAQHFLLPSQVLRRNWPKSGSEPRPLWRREPGLNLFAGICKKPHNCVVKHLYCSGSVAHSKRDSNYPFVRHCKHLKRIGALRSGRVLHRMLQTFS